MIVQLDECTPFHVEKSYTLKSTERSIRWGERSLRAFERYGQPHQGLIGVIQGGTYEDLRIRSLEATLSQNYHSIAIGGSLGETRQQMHEVIDMTMANFLKIESVERARHLFGIGDIRDIFHGVASGIDTFDCVLPTRMARHGHALIPFALKNDREKSLHEKGKISALSSQISALSSHTSAPSPQGLSYHAKPFSHPRPANNRIAINLKNSQYKDSDEPLDPSIPNQASQYSRAYIHHLFKVGEIAAMNILSEHNVYQMGRLMRDIRSAIARDNLTEAKLFWLGES